MPRPSARNLAGIVALSAAVAGCGSPENPIPLHPAEGRVLAQGKPLAGVRVMLRPAGADPAPVPVGTTDADGKFRLSTAAGEGRLADGAPAGDYEVAISMPARSDSAGFLGKPAPTAPAFDLPPAYADPKASGLKATIKPGENAIGPFELKSAGSGAPKPASSSQDDRGR